MRGTSKAAVVALATLLAATLALAAEAPRPERGFPEHVEAKSVAAPEAVASLRVGLPGRLAASTVVPGPWKSPTLFLIVKEWPGGEAPTAGARQRLPRALYRLDLAPGAADAALELLEGPLPADVDDHLDWVRFGGAADATHLLLRGAGFVRLVPLGGEWRGSGAIEVRSHEARRNGRRLRLLDRGVPVFVSASVGRLEVVRLDPDSSATTSGFLDLPIDVERERSGLFLRSPAVHLARLDPTLLAIGPRAVGDLRLQTLLAPIALAFGGSRSSDVGQEWAAPGSADAPQGEGEPQSRWSLLPGPERVVTSVYLPRDDRTLLLVATVRADKMGFLERKKLRLFELGPDRTRVGSPPLLDALSASRRWQRIDPHLIDYDRDGLDDLLVIQPEGLGGNKITVDLYRGRPGGFDERLRTVVPTRQSEWHAGTDWTGDRVPDLLVRSGGELQLYPGLPAPLKKAVVERRPRWTHPLGGVGAAPEAEAEAGEERRMIAQGPALLVRSRAAGGRDLLEVLMPKAASASRPGG